MKYRIQFGVREIKERRVVVGGMGVVVSAGCNSGLDAAFLAHNAIRFGDADIMIMGGSEAPIIPRASL